jgi:hypothetical protein
VVWLLEHRRICICRRADLTNFKSNGYLIQIWPNLCSRTLGPLSFNRMNFLLTFLLAFSMLAVPISPKRKKDKPKPVTVEGSFSSTRGVMQSLSCYCYDAGYIQTDEGKSIPVCFENDELSKASEANSDFQCARLKVKGVYVTKTIPQTDNSPCPAGTMTYLKVLDWECK